MKKTIRLCQNCGKSFYGSKDNFYCTECANERKINTVVKTRICQDCNKEFIGGPRAKRCPDCAYIAKKEALKKYKKESAKRPIGSTDKCVICGKEYVVISGRQKYCSKECQRIGVLQWQKEHKHKIKYHKNSGQDIKKQNRRSEVTKICIYCLRLFKTDTSTNLCSDYCKTEQRKMKCCESDLKRGYKRNLQKYIDKRQEYRELVASGKETNTTN